MPNRNISKPIINRLPHYYRQLKALHMQGRRYITSAALAELLRVSQSQVRQDFCILGLTLGQQGRGYEVELLLAALEGLLYGDGAVIRAVLVGTNRLGVAAAELLRATQGGFELAAAFDTEHDFYGLTAAGVVVRPMRTMESYCRKEGISMAIMCVPQQAAAQLCDTLLRAGVTGFLNLSPYHMELENAAAAVENVDLSASLLALSHRMHSRAPLPGSSLNEQLSLRVRRAAKPA